jgi:hypothetical protein
VHCAERRLHQLAYKMSLFRNLFGRRSRFSFRRRQPIVTPRRGGFAFGTLAAIIAPFLVRRFRQRRMQATY